MADLGGSISARPTEIFDIVREMCSIFRATFFNHDRRLLITLVAARAMVTSSR